ncbi:amidohydrolase [Marinobacter nanhaiticus D15-8W]|uniref:Amidohydrolase n=1 Tax=Marinobacter nanhaiticus D15-8W TaxID=626887 RepID=N6X2H1_9GAMM|nr:amidohydrolase [Marinobacter nanhaiticus]ENO15243.2 amidohydrolase [Marinobacter nanhaiticus D15-8W]BES69055.1 amidohydrolase [Marinobacter nanhaiticus D15-8W]
MKRSGVGLWAAWFAALLVILAGLTSASRAAESADAIWHNGIIITINDAAPQAEAIAVTQGRIQAVGREAEVMALRDEQTRVHDLQGRTLLPGFVDAHGHVSYVGFQALSANLLPPPDGQVSSIAQLQQTLRDFAPQSRLLEDFGVIYGFGYDDSQLAERRHPTRDELDAVSADTPIFVIHQSSHLGVLNSAALERDGIDENTADPPGGRIGRGADSRVPNGVLEENAFFMALGKLYPDMDTEQAIDMLKQGEALYTRYGYTTLQDGRSAPDQVRLTMAAAEAGQLKADIVSYPDILVEGTEALLRPLYFQPAGTPPEYHNRFRIGGIKLTLDGSPQGRTAWLSQPYFRPPPGEPGSYAGYGVVDDKAVAEIYTRALRNRWQTLTHANGDKAIDQMIAAWREAEAAVPGVDVRPVLVHGQTLRRDQVPALKEMGIFPSLFPMHTFYWGDWHREVVLGPSRAEHISPTGWVLGAGLRFTSHHDAPVVLPDAMRVLDATVNRVTRAGRVLGHYQRVSPRQALKAMTLWAAYQHFEEDSKGSLEVGKLADFVVLSDNPLTVEQYSIHKITVLETIKEGQSIYRH